MNTSGRSRWHLERGAFRVRGTQWTAFEGHSTNRLWRGAGPSGEWLLKWYRYPHAGVHPEPEVAQFLRAEGYDGVPEFGARLDAFLGEGWTTRAFVQRWISGTSAWDRILAMFRSGECETSYARDLGLSVGKLHATLGSGARDTPFEAIPWDAAAQQRGLERLKQGVQQWLAALQGDKPAAVAAEIWMQLRRAWVDGGNGWREKVGQLEKLQLDGVQSRIHGDLHLGQVLEQDPDAQGRRFWFVDFEGEPTRPLAERRLRDTPLRDAAGMWRSFAYAAAMSGATMEAQTQMQEAFLEGWCSGMPSMGGQWRAFLEGLTWEKALYEALYELRHRPDWLWIPLRALQAL
ncbi:MAG: hypothetical protein EBS01_01110 [Verrucomicrobia bacterium]|nr:hypothetical protein [Verrucomicrobiota bacterium]